MNKKETKIQIALGTYLQTKWEEYLKILEEAEKLRTKEIKIDAKAYRLYTKAEKLHAQGSEFYDEAEKLAVGEEIEEMELYKQGKVLRIEGKNLRLEGNKFDAQARELSKKRNKLYRKGRLGFENAVKKVYGKDTTIIWSILNRCKLENGIVFE